jgi:PAS domain S-box-containing protein
MGFYKKYNYIIWFTSAGIGFWVLDSVLDYLTFYNDSFMNLFLASIPPHELYIRLIVLAILITSGFITQNLRNKTKKDLVKLQESEQKFKSLADSISEVFWIGSPEWQDVYYVNPGYENVWGKSTDSLIKKPLSWLDSVLKEDKESVLNYMKEIRNESLKDFELPIFRIKTRGNKIKWIRAKGKIIEDIISKKELAIGFAEDISEFKKIEESLAHERDIARIYLKISGVMFVALNDKGNITLVNDKAVETLEYENESELIGKNWFKTCLPEEMVDPVNDVFKQLMAGKVEPVEFYENPVITKNGKTKIILWHNSNLKDQDGKLIGILSSGQDITEKKKAEKTLEDRKDELESMVEQRMKEIDDKNERLQESQNALTYLLEDVNEARKEVQLINEKLEIAVKELEAFSYSVSHDLKAPLRAIDGFSQILLEDYSDAFDEEGKRYIKIVRENSQRMGELIQDLLDLSRVGRAKLKLEEVDFNTMIKEILTDELNNTGSRIIKTSVKELPVVMADKSLIRQVWQNYISNAIKFTSNEKTAKIEIGYKEDKKVYEFYIRDNGVGFNMKYIGKLFNVFQRLHTIEVFEGTGIGLALSKSIVVKHNGKVNAKANPGKGAVFYFTLPKANI